jgi:hypothetical protein
VGRCVIERGDFSNVSSGRVLYSQRSLLRWSRNANNLIRMYSRLAVNPSPCFVAEVDQCHYSQALMGPHQLTTYRSQHHQAQVHSTQKRLRVVDPKARLISITFLNPMLTAIWTRRRGRIDCWITSWRSCRTSSHTIAGTKSSTHAQHGQSGSSIRLFSTSYATFQRCWNMTIRPCTTLE